MPLDPRLLDVLACPQDKGPLYVLDDALYNPRLHLRYPITDGIPVMLADEATTLDDPAHAELMATVERTAAPMTRTRPATT